MTIAEDIIFGRPIRVEAYLEEGNDIDDLDEYGFPLLVECAIAGRIDAAEALLKAGASIQVADTSGRTPLHWAVYQNDLEMTRFLLTQGANANGYAVDGLSILVYPYLRHQDEFKKLLYQYGAKLDFAIDFIHAKLLGHRFELKGSVDILNGQGEFVEVDYEGFILEFTVALVKDALNRFMNSFSTRRFQDYFKNLYPVIDGFELAGQLLQLQHRRGMDAKHATFLEYVLQAPLLILPAASRGHAIGFVRYQNWFAIVDRGEHAKQAGSVNIYRMLRPNQFNGEFLKQFLYQRQPRSFFHQTIHTQLGLDPVMQLPIPPQTVGNCSWANIQALIPAAYFLQQIAADPEDRDVSEAMTLFDAWVEWDQDRALDDCISRFEHVPMARQASIAEMLAGVLFQACDADQPHDLARAEKIIPIVSQYPFILNSYFEVYCVQQLTYRGNNLLKLLDDCGVNPNIGVNLVGTGLKKKG